MQAESVYKIANDNAGKKEIIWWNTNIEKPTLKELNEAAQKEFPGVNPEKLGVLSGFMSLTLKEGHSILGRD